MDLFFADLDFDSSPQFITFVKGTEEVFMNVTIKLDTISEVEELFLVAIVGVYASIPVTLKQDAAFVRIRESRKSSAAFEWGFFCISVPCHRAYPHLPHNQLPSGTIVNLVVA